MQGLPMMAGKAIYELNSLGLRGSSDQLREDSLCFAFYDVLMLQLSRGWVERQFLEIIDIC
jgi:hypothetical protein